MQPFGRSAALIAPGALWLLVLGLAAGVAGYFDGTTLDSCVLIRYVEQAEDGLYFRSGGGITVNSACEKEYAEAVRKIYLPFT